MFVISLFKGNFVDNTLLINPPCHIHSSKNLARISAAEVAYKYLIKEGLFFTIFDEIGEPKLDTAVGQLQELAQKGYCEMPKYIFMEYHNESGNPLWYCDCVVKDCNITYPKIHILVIPHYFFDTIVEQEQHNLHNLQIHYSKYE